MMMDLKAHKYCRCYNYLPLHQQMNHSYVEAHTLWCYGFQGLLSEGAFSDIFVCTFFILEVKNRNMLIFLLSAPDVVGLCDI